MSIQRSLSIAVFVVLVLAGCARKQEQAAKLEQEVIAQESGAVLETIVDAGAVPKETFTGVEPTADANAIPSETYPDAKQQARIEPAPVSVPPAAVVKADSDAATAEVAAESSPAVDANAIPTNEAPQSLSQKPAGAGFAIQVAACNEAGYARQLADTYVSRGYRAYVDETTRGGATFYRVRLGPVATQSEAQAIAREVTAKYGVDAWVASVGP